MFEADRAEAAAGNSALLHLTCCCKRDLDDGEAVRHGHVCVFSVTLWLLLIDRGRTRGKENDRLCDFLTSQTLFPLTLHVIIPEERLQKARLRLSHEKLIICHMLLDISSILLLLILQNESRCLWACWQTMYTEMLLRSHCVEESQTALIDLLMSHFLTETRKNF